MAATALLCARRSRNPNLTFNCRFFSPSSRSNDAGGNSPSPPSSSSSSSSSSTSSYLSDVKASLKQPPRESSSFPSAPSPSLSSKLEEIRKNLSEFRPRVSGTTPSTPRQPSSSPPISFQELYKRNVIPNNEAAQRGKPSFDTIRESLRQMRPSSSAKDGQANEKRDPMSLSAFKDTLRIRPLDPGANKSSAVIGGSKDALPMAIFGKDMKKRKEAEGAATRTEFVKTYSYRELGEKLSILRPETRGENWFSVSELNERLVKLREMELKKTDESYGGVNIRDLREGLLQLRKADEEKAKKSSKQRLGFLGHIGGTPTLMLGPPKEHLIEQYYHPDNMSSAEKMKLELKKVRDEFKMSESDCGSARVQVAQLTTKIKHLNSVLLKKDKHSRKGLLAMVQRRKKLLKYLRRTDWDSYCLVLSKLGLRDTPDHKPIRQKEKKQSGSQSKKKIRQRRKRVRLSNAA